MLSSNHFPISRRFRRPRSGAYPLQPFLELSRDLRKLQFICQRQTLKSICSPSLTLRNILEGQGDADAYKELLKNLKIFRFWYLCQGRGPSIDTVSPNRWVYLNEVNTYWLFSSLFSIPCTLVALSLQRWTKPRTWVTPPCYSLPEQARWVRFLVVRIKRSNIS